MSETTAMEYPGEPLPDEDIQTSHVDVATRWAAEYSNRLREVAAALADVVAQLDCGRADRALLDQQQSRLREAEDLMARLRYWNDRESALRSR